VLPTLFGPGHVSHITGHFWRTTSPMISSSHVPVYVAQSAPSDLPLHVPINVVAAVVGVVVAVVQLSHNTGHNLRRVSLRTEPLHWLFLNVVAQSARSGIPLHVPVVVVAVVVVMVMVVVVAVMVVVMQVPHSTGHSSR
jgi:uncharacterized membrane protein YoaK (UPF0700 family)